MHRPDSIRVLLAATRPILPTEVQFTLTRNPGWHLVGTVPSAVEATRVARLQQPQVAICDAALPDAGAFELARFFRLRMPTTQVAFVTTRESEDELFEAVRVGAAAYLRGSMDARGFLRALERVAQGEFLIDEDVVRNPKVASRVLAQFRLNPTSGGEAGRPGAPEAAHFRTTSGDSEALAPLFVPLSAREIEILDLVARGNSNKLIARQLGISDQTVKNHVTAILRKLEVNDRTEAVVYALRKGWIHMDSLTRVTR